MAVVCLPCEILQRELEHKLLLSAYLAGRHGHQVFIGYDKYFTLILPKLKNILLLDKSLSDVIFRARVQHVHNNGGRVAILDEEGINNIGVINQEGTRARVSSECIAACDLYFCWGELDQDFYSSFSLLKPKMSLVGSSRSDLLSAHGRLVYHNTINSINTLFSNFVLVSDNFAIDRFGFKGVPDFSNISTSERQLLIHSFEYNTRLSVSRRSFFTDLLLDLISSFPEQIFVIRPHPLSRPDWWFKNFSSFRNVHIVSAMTAEPWLLSSIAVVSIGCTLGLQALVAGKPLLEVDHPKHPSYGLASRLLTDPISDISSFRSKLSSAINTNYVNSFDVNKLNSSWYNLDNFSGALISEELNSLTRSLPKCHYKLPSIKELHIDSSKWSFIPSLSYVNNFLSNVCNTFHIPLVIATPTSAAVWQISRP